MRGGGKAFRFGGRNFELVCIENSRSSSRRERARVLIRCIPRAAGYGLPNPVPGARRNASFEAVGVCARPKHEGCCDGGTGCFHDWEEFLRARIATRTPSSPHHPPF